MYLTDAKFNGFWQYLVKIFLLRYHLKEDNIAFRKCLARLFAFNFK